MGQSSSQDENPDKMSEIINQFSKKEKEILKKYCMDYSNQKPGSILEFSKRLSDKIYKGVMDYFEKEKKLSKYGIGVWLPEAVIKLTKGTIEQLGYSIFIVFTSENDQIAVEQLKNDFTELLMTIYNNMESTSQFKVDERDCKKLLANLFGDFPQTPTQDNLIEFLYKHSLLVDFLQTRFYTCFFGCLPEVTDSMMGTVPVLLPKLLNTKKGFNIPLATAVFVNSKLPLECQYEWRFLFSSNINGESFTKLCSNITDEGPLLLYVTDSDGHRFGGFVSTSCSHNAQFQGDRRSFLFLVEPQMGIYTTTGYNDHYAYLNIGQETLPNGFGMGGQHGFFGLWIDSEFGLGHSKAKRTCTTYSSPQLSKQENFKIHQLEVWGVGKKPKKINEEEVEMSVLDKHVDAKAMLEIIGKERVSEGLRDADPEADIPEEKELYHAHNPMQ